VGDIIMAVDQEPVDGYELDAIKQLTIGDEGTFCTLQMLRGNQYFAVTLQRITPNTLNESNYEAAIKVMDQRSFSSSVSPQNSRQYSGRY
jgi:C-terminal processing protease CtpA/Prc